MTTHDAIRRVRTGGIAVLGIALFLLLPARVSAVDAACATRASDELNEQLSQAYEDFNEEMQQLAEQLNERTQMAYSSSSSSRSNGNGNRNDVTPNQNTINAAYQEYSYGQSEANRRLGSKVNQAWNSYHVQYAACDGSNQQYYGQNSSQYYQDPNQYYYGATNNNQYYYGAGNNQYYQYQTVDYGQQYSNGRRYTDYQRYVEELNRYNRDYNRRYQEYLQQFYHPYPCPYHQH